jgi:hypothetical protein
VNATTDLALAVQHVDSALESGVAPFVEEAVLDL